MILLSESLIAGRIGMLCKRWQNPELRLEMIIIPFWEKNWNKLSKVCNTGEANAWLFKVIWYSIWYLDVQFPVYKVPWNYISQGMVWQKKV